MKRYYFIQYFQRISSGVAVIALMIGVVFSLWYLLSKPGKSKILLDDFERISFSNDLKCDKMQLSESSVAEQFPISFSYETNDIDVGIDTDTEHFKSEFQINNAARIFIRFSNYDFDHEVELKVIELPYSPSTNLVINAGWFSWDTTQSIGGFNELKDRIPKNLFPPRPSCDGLEMEPEQCDILQNNYDDSLIAVHPKTSYEVGLCGQNLSYLPKYHSATVDDLYSMGVKVVPLDSGISGLSLFRMYFSNVLQLKIDGHTISIPADTEKVETFVLLSNSSDNNLFNIRPAKPSIEFVATNISDYLILGGDSSTSAAPGLVYIYDEGNEDEYIMGRYRDISPMNIRFNDNRITIVSPKGSIIANSPKIDIPANTYQMILHSNIFNPLQFDFNDKNLYHYWSRGGGV